MVIQQGEYCFQAKLVELIKILNNLGARNLSELDLEIHILLVVSTPLKKY